MERIKKNFGFGCMRLPMKDGEVDLKEFSKMVDEFLRNGAESLRCGLFRYLPDARAGCR